VRSFERVQFAPVFSRPHATMHPILKECSKANI
jgi:hypothetical protein